ncbi:MAG: hypothetical protein LVQ95_05490 [Candidatus Micrarchaeales archaeon]|nr:hypothetical protein [Candidatus Micrarchaeales archaeon]
METRKIEVGKATASDLDEIRCIFSESAPKEAERFLPLWNSAKQTFSDALAYHDKGDEASCRSLLGHMDGFIRASIGTAFGIDLSDGSGTISELRDSIARISVSDGSAPEALIAGRLLSAAILIERYATAANSPDGAKPMAVVAPLPPPPPPAPQPRSAAFMAEEEIHRYSVQYFNGDERREKYEEALSTAMGRLAHAPIPAALKGLAGRIDGIWQYGAGSLEQLRSFIDTMVTNPNVMKTLESNAREFASALVDASRALNALTSYIEKQKSARQTNRR